MDLLSVISSLGPLIKDYSIIFVFATSLFLGEEIVLILSFLSANGFLPLWVVFVFCFAGRVISDFFFFLLGKLELSDFLKKYQGGKVYKKVDKVFSKLNRKSIFVTLLYTKFLVGLRAAMMVYIGIKGISIKKVIIGNAGAILVWLLVLIPIGWFAGSSFKLILIVFRDLKIAVLFLIVFAIIGFFISRYIHKKILDRRTQLLLA